MSIDFTPSGAEKYIDFFHELEIPTKEEYLKLTVAHYTLASDIDLSLNKCKMHANTAITLLQNIQEDTENLGPQIAKAYFKRAELLEEEYDFLAAIRDYERTLEVLEPSLTTHALNDADHELAAQCAILIAAFIVRDQIDINDVSLNHPLYYVNKSLEHLAVVSNWSEETYKMQVYAHQLAGISLSQHDVLEAKHAFRIALQMVSQTKPLENYSMLADIYNCLGILLTEHYNAYAIQIGTHVFMEESKIYFGLTSLFSEKIADEEDLLELEQLFEIIYRLLDPFLSPLPQSALQDLIDALITLYMGVLNKNLPNQSLNQHLLQPETQELLDHHIYRLMLKAYKLTCPPYDLLEISDPTTINLSLNESNLLAVLNNTKMDNIHYLHSVSAVV